MAVFSDGMLLKSYGAPISLVGVSDGFGSGSSGVDVAAPAGIQDGDLLVALIYSGTANAKRPSSIWDETYNPALPGSPYFTIISRTASGEGATINVEFEASQGRVILYVFRNATLFNLGTARRLNSSSQATNAMDVSGGGFLIYVVGGNGAAPGSGQSVAGMTLGINSQGSNPDAISYYQVSVPGTGVTKSLSMSGASLYTNMLFEVLP